MLGVGHMVCAEDARTGIALEWQKIYREWVGLQVQKEPGCSFLLLKASTRVRKTPPCLQNTARVFHCSQPLWPRPQLQGPPSWHFQQCPPSPPHLQSPAPAVRPRPSARSAPHPSADSLARNSEPRGPETPSPGRAGPAAGKKRALSLPRTPASGPVSNPATPGGSPPRPFLSPAQHRLPKPGRLPARGPYSSRRRARADVITLGGPRRGQQ